MVERNSARSWSMFVILMLCGIAIGVCQFKVTPVMVLLSEELGVSTTSAAWLMSIFTLAGVVLSIPGAGVIAKAGPKRTLLIMLLMLVTGSLMGAVAPTFELMLLSRVVEGVAAVFALPVGVDLIGRWFKGAEVGTATGIFMTATPIATFVMTSCGLPVANALGSVRSLWWVTFAYSLACLVLAIFFLSEPAPNGADLEPAGEGAGGVGEALGVALRSRPLVLLCGAMFFLATCLYSLITGYPQLFSFYGMSAEFSNLLSSLNGLIGIPMSVVAGIVIGRTGKPHRVALVGAVGTFAVVSTLPYLGPATYALNVIGSAIFPGGIVMAPMFCLAPVLVGRLDCASMGTCLINTFFYLGQLVSTPLVTTLSENNTNWTTPSVVLSVSCVVFFALTLASERAYRQSYTGDTEGEGVDA